MGPPFSVLIMNTKKLTRYIGIAMVLGIVVGYFCNNHAQNPQEARRSPRISASSPTFSCA